MSLKNKSLLITGGTGTFGSAFVKYCLTNTNLKKIIIFSRDEMKQYIMFNSFNKNHRSKIRFFIGDIRDKDRLKMAMNGVDFVVHAAALKQVDTAEYNPFEAVKTNILGTQNIIESALNSNVSKVIGLSTDKASSPINLYGATKLTSDKLLISANNYKGKKDISFSVVRYGNVFGSRGSVLNLFLKQSRNKSFTVTDKRMTRFNITIEDAVKFILNSIEIMKGSEIFIPKLKTYKITDLIRSISNSASIRIIGLRPGEKLHEEMISKNDPSHILEFKKFYILLPNSYDLSKYKTIKRNNYKVLSESFSYNSFDNKNYLTIKELKSMIANYKNNTNDLL